MAISKFQAAEVPLQIAPEVRAFLDDTLAEIADVLNAALIGEEAEGVYARLAEDETVTGAWTFNDTITIATPGTDYSLFFSRNSVQTGGFYHDLTSQYWLNNLGQTVLQNAYGSKDVTLGASMNISGNIHKESSALYAVTPNFTLDPDDVGGSNPALTYKTPTHAYTAITGTLTDILAYSLYIADGTVNSRVGLWLDPTGGEWGLSETYSSSGLFDFVITAGGGTPRMRIDFANDEITLASRVICTEGAYALSLESTAPKLLWDETDATTDERLYDIVAAGGELRFRILKDDQSASHDYMKVVRTGFSEALSLSPATLNLAPAGNINVTSSSGNFQLLSGLRFYAFEPSNSDRIELFDNGVNGYLQTNVNDLVVRAGASGASLFGISAVVSIADDATHEFVHNGTGYTMWFLGNSFNHNTQCIIFCAGTSAYLAAGNTAAGSLSVGTSGTNPDVDGDLNVWTDGGGNLWIKNRLGSTRRFTAFCISF